jgi:hypothetical protein
MKKMDRIINQGTSGRWWLTIIAGTCLLMITFVDCKAVMKDKEPPFSAEAIFSIVTMVFVSYFNKSKENGDVPDAPPVDPNGNGVPKEPPAQP